MTRAALVLIASLTAACGSDSRRSRDCPPGDDCPTPTADMGTPPATCVTSDYNAAADAICTVNHPEPAPRSLGATCVDDGQCDSGLCADRFTGGQYCTIACPRGDECPVGYRCDESGRIDGVDTLCFREVCVYGGSDRADCIGNFLDDVDSVCTDSSCTGGELDLWVDCLEAAGRLCGPGEACVLERDALERCCVGCSSFTW